MNRALRDRCAGQLAQLDLPRPFDLNELCTRVGRQRGRDIKLVPISLPARAPCGMWAATDDCDYVFVQERTSRFHQALIGLHELSHILFGHVSAAAMDARTTSLLAPNLNPALIQHMLGRTHYSETIEREAEALASLILSHAGEWSPVEPPSVPAEIAGLVERLEASLLRVGHRE